MNTSVREKFLKYTLKNLTRGESCLFVKQTKVFVTQRKFILTPSRLTAKVNGTRKSFCRVRFNFLVKSFKMFSYKCLPL